MTGEQLRERRKKLGLSQASLAKLLNVAENTIARNERGVNPIQNPTMLDLALKTLERNQENERKQ